VSTIRLLAAATFMLVPALAASAVADAVGPELIVPREGIDWEAGTVTVSASYPAGAASLSFTVSGQPLATVPVADTTVAGIASAGVAYHLTAPVQFGVGIADAQGVSLGTSIIPVSPASFRPSAPRMRIRQGSIVGPSFKLEAKGSPASTVVTAIRLEAGPEPAKHVPKLVRGDGGRIFVRGVRLPYGIERLRLVAENGFGSSRPSPAKRLFNLGPLSRLPRRSRYVLVDKRSMTLYEVRRRRVIRHYDVAVGTPSTPTPLGRFKIGRPEPSSGPWGVLRRPLYRFSGRRKWATGFYIHGTDTPWSIGTWASHGCVRMFNRGIRRFSRTVPNGTLVLIRR
jgi:hypothetical protein